MESDEFVDLKKQQELLDAANAEYGDTSDYDVDPEDSILSDIVSEEYEDDLTPEEVADQNNDAIELGSLEGDDDAFPESMEAPEAPGFNHDDVKYNMITGNEIADKNSFEGGVIPPTKISTIKVAADGKQDEGIYLLYGFNIIQDGAITPVNRYFPTMEAAKSAVSGEYYYTMMIPGDRESVVRFQIRSGTPGICVGDQELFRYKNEEWMRS